MYRWYQEAQVCYVYLEDVGNDHPILNIQADNEDAAIYRVPSIKWLTRGWTLQELIAPPFVIFFTRDWSQIGTRDTMKNWLTTVTHISRDALSGVTLENFSVAEKMSWASERRTTRVEDEAYCLLGLFGVSMPLIYGEGTKAFRRLQEEIIKQSDDETMFAWKAYYDDHHIGCFAKSPSDFDDSRSFRCFKKRNSRFYRGLRSQSPFTVTNKGIQITLPIIEYETIIRPPLRYIDDNRTDNSPSNRNHLAILNCYQAGSEDRYVALFIHKTEMHGIYARNKSTYLVSVPTDYAQKKARSKQIVLRIDGDGAGLTQRATLLATPIHRKLVVFEPFPSVLCPARNMKIRFPYQVGAFPSFHYQANNSITAKIPLFAIDFLKFSDGKMTTGKPIAMTFESILGPILIAFGFKSENIMMAAITCISNSVAKIEPTNELSKVYLSKDLETEAKKLLEDSLAKLTSVCVPRKQGWKLVVLI